MPFKPQLELLVSETGGPDSHRNGRIESVRLRHRVAAIIGLTSTQVTNCQVSGVLAPGAEVRDDFAISHHGDAVIYRADQGTGGVHLWMSRAPVETVGWVMD